MTEQQQATHKSTMIEQVLPQLASQRGVAGVHLLIADTAASQIKTEERRLRSGDHPVPAWVLLLESWGDEAQFVPLCIDTLQVANRLQQCGAEGNIRSGFYKLQSTRLKTAWSAGG